MNAFKGFHPKGVALLKQIEADNSKAWLQAHKSEYERYILAPNRAYVEEMGEHLRILTPSLHAEPKIDRSLFRIYRDERYHADAPIKTQIGIIVWQGDGHRMQSSAFYMHYSKNEVFVATGIRRFKPPLLKHYRNYLQNEAHRRTLHDIYERLRQKGYMIAPASFKRMPRSCDPSDSYAYLYLKDACYAYTVYKPDEIFFSEEVIYRHFKIYEEMFALHRWVYEMRKDCKSCQ